jgi:hypothetical protein
LLLRHPAPCLSARWRQGRFIDSARHGFQSFLAVPGGPYLPMKVFVGKIF